MRDWEPLTSRQDALDGAIRLHLLARKIQRVARETGETNFLVAARQMLTEAEALAEIGLGHFGDDVQH